MPDGEGLIGGCFSLVVGVIVVSFTFDVLKGIIGLSVLLYSIGGILILFGIYAIISSLKAPG